MPDYDYGELLVPFIVVWLAVRCEHLPAPTTRISLLAIASLLLSIAVWLVAYQASSNIGEQLMIPAILWSAVWSALGLPIAMRLAVPIACLYFAIPLWEFLVPILQSVAVRVTETILGVVGIPVHIEGFVVSIPEGTFKIAEGCAGRRYFVVCVTIAALLAGTTRMRPLRAAAFLIVAAALSIVTNWLRILTVIYAGHVTNMQSYLVRVEHLSFGWALFAVLMVVVCLIGSRFAQSGTLPPVHSEQRRGAAAMRELLMRPSMPIVLSILLIPFLAVMYSQNVLASTAASHGDRTVLLRLPMDVSGWSGPRSPGEEWQPRYPGAAAVQRGSYAGAAGDVEVFLAEYARSLRGRKLVSYVNTLFPADWMVLHRQDLRIGTANAAGPKVELLRLETPLGERWVLTYLYRVGGFDTRSATLAQITDGVLAWGGLHRSRIAAVASRCRPSCDAATARVRSFWSLARPQLLAQP